jgi:hypothetical protein
LAPPIRYAASRVNDNGTWVYCNRCQQSPEITGVGSDDDAVFRYCAIHNSIIANAAQTNMDWMDSVGIPSGGEVANEQMRQALVHKEFHAA